MRLAGRGSLLFGALALPGVVAFVGCQNPLAPLDKSDKIQGLSYIGVTAGPATWDSDPENDGLVIDVSYNDEFGNPLSFHDKPHDVVIELRTQPNIEKPEEFQDQGVLFFSRTFRHSNSDDSIRIPVELYLEQMKSHFDSSTTIYSGFTVVQVRPPQGYPRLELLVAQPDVEFWAKPESK